MPRPQFTLRALLVLMLAVALFFGGVYVGRRSHQIESQQAFAQQRAELMRLRDEARKGQRRLEEQKRLARQGK